MIIYPDPSLVPYANTVVQIEGLLFGVELDGVEWIFNQLDGWHLGGGVETSFEPRAGAHGTHDGPVYRRARVVTIGGTCVAPDPATAEDAAEALAACLADGQLGSFTVSGARRALSCDVRLSDTPQSAWFDETTFSWSLQFTAPDWRKYGTEEVDYTGLRNLSGGGLTFPISGGVFDFNADSESGSVSFYNAGTAWTEPLITVSGPLAAGFEITYAETGQRLRYEAPVGSPLVLDCAAGRATTDGQDRSVNLTVREWFSVPPKSSATFRFSTLGAETYLDDAQLRLDAAPAYH